MKLPNLQLARFNRGLTQAELSDKSGVHRCTISNIEQGLAGASPKTAHKLSDALNYPLMMLVSDKKEDLLYGPKRIKKSHQATGGGNRTGDNSDDIEHKAVDGGERRYDMGSEGVQSGPDDRRESGELPERTASSGTPEGTVQGSGFDSVPRFLDPVTGEPDFSD